MSETVLVTGANRGIGLELVREYLKRGCKVYGVCRVTGKLISKERLRAVPHATLSIEAKQNRKK